MDKPQSLTDFMDSVGPVKGFKPNPYLCPDSDTLTMYFEDTPSYAERVDSELTVFKSFDSNEVIGFELKGILPKMEELARMIHVTASTPKVHVRLILMICLAKKIERREPYEDLVEKASEFDEANVPMQTRTATARISRSPL
ncbi:MAG: hypothetical protein ABSF95_02890 [Verrucomicrobiota bacterium]|jgi:hypothetical protein